MKWNKKKLNKTNKKPKPPLKLNEDRIKKNNKNIKVLILSTII